MNTVDRIYLTAFKSGYQSRALKIASIVGKASAIADSIKGHVKENPGAYIGGAVGAAGGAAVGAATGGKGKRIGRAILGSLLGGGAGAGIGYGYDRHSENSAASPYPEAKDALGSPSRSEAPDRAAMESRSMRPGAPGPSAGDLDLGGSSSQLRVTSGDPGNLASFDSPTGGLSLGGSGLTSPEDLAAAAVAKAQMKSRSMRTGAPGPSAGDFDSGNPAGQLPVTGGDPGDLASFDSPTGGLSPKGSGLTSRVISAAARNQKAREKEVAKASQQRMGQFDDWATKENTALSKDEASVVRQIKNRDLSPEIERRMIESHIRNTRRLQNRNLESAEALKGNPMGVRGISEDAEVSRRQRISEAEYLQNTQR